MRRIRQLIGRLLLGFFYRRPADAYQRMLYDFIYKHVGKVPRHMNLYVQAMTHRSCHVPDQPRHVTINERLEFLGDAVLDLCVGECSSRPILRQKKACSPICGARSLIPNISLTG